MRATRSEDLGPTEDEIVTEQPQDDMPTLETPDSEGDRSSITDHDGSIARFEMAYSPGEHERFAFGPPLWQRAPSLLCLAGAMALVVLVAVAYSGASSASVYLWLTTRPVNALPLTFLVTLCAVGVCIRAGLRGVIVTRDGVEARDLLPFGVPRIRRWSWAQIDRLIVADDDVMLELWNGTYEKLPPVREGTKLAELLGRIATSRGRTVTRLAAKV